MKTTTPVFTCDAPGCKSTCTLTADQGPTAAAELVKRGWAVAGDADTGKTYCPAHRQQVPATTD